MTPFMTERRVARIEDCSEDPVLSVSDMGPPVTRTDEAELPHASG
jgi:hypothetical protein